MKKKHVVGIIAVGVLLIAGVFAHERLRVNLQTNEKGKSISIIGGADGPTSIFVAGNSGGPDKMASFKSISMEEAKEAFTLDGTYIIVDVRRADEYAEGHIPGAINIANEDILDKEPAELPDKNQLIYVYCRSGRRSQQAATKLAALGYMNITECGGILDWTGDVE